MASIAEVAQALAAVPAEEQRLRRSDFDLTNGSTGSKVEVASYQAKVPLALREEAMRLVLVTEEDFTTDGTADNTETFNLSNNIIQTGNTADLVLYEGGSRVQPDSIDYGANSFDYTDDGTNNNLHAFYVFRNPVQVSVEKEAPSAQGGVSEVMYDDATSVLHERNQNKEPPVPSFTSPLQPVVPVDWKLKVYADGPTAVEWDEGTDDTTGTNALLRMPVNRAQRNVSGLARAVKQDIVGRV
jgi:hypothetical protein